MSLRTIDVDGFLVSVDVEETQAVYSRFEPSCCDCSYCRNFRAQWNELIVPSFSENLRAIGIDAPKPVEIVEYCRNEDGSHFYQVDWPFIGPEVSESSQGSGGRAFGLEVGVAPRGIPCKEFDATGHRWSSWALFRRVPWRLSEPEFGQR